MNANATQKSPKNTAQQATSCQKQDEMIMVVKRTDLFGSADDAEVWQGLRRDNLQTYLDRMHTHRTFMPRSLMETDPTYIQIIPYLVFTYDNKYFLMQRKAEASEQRLRNKISLGIGGHLRAEDITGTDLFAWAQREFHEEVAYVDRFSVSFYGIINDDSNDVGKVHIGPVLLVSGTSPHIAIKSEHKSGELVSLDQCALMYDNLESWSQLILRSLIDNSKS